MNVHREEDLYPVMAVHQINLLHYKRVQVLSVVAPGGCTHHPVCCVVCSCSMFERVDSCFHIDLLRLGVGELCENEDADWVPTHSASVRGFIPTCPGWAAGVDIEWFIPRSALNAARAVLSTWDGSHRHLAMIWALIRQMTSSSVP